MDSDSSDDETSYFGNVALMLQTYKKELGNNLKTPDTECKKENKSIKDDNAAKYNFDDSLLNTEDDSVIDEILAKNSKLITSSTGNDTTTTENTSTGRKTARKCNSNRGRGSSSKRARKSKNTASDKSVSQESVPSQSVSQENIMDASIEITGVSQAQETGRRRSTRTRTSRRQNQANSVFEQMCSLISSYTTNYPTFNIGNTDEYPDQSHSVQLFSNNVPDKPTTIPLDDTIDLEENEELSVKVNWQSMDIFKFSLRKYQKFTEVFSYFSEKENVSNDKLYFTYNERVLKPEDTPDSIEYNIAKFIEGGIVNHSLTNLNAEKKQSTVVNGINLKFQCQNSKKPFEVVIKKEDKLSLPMVKCAEHFNVPINKLKFEFDGDVITGKQTATDLDLEGGECIDVKIIS